MALRVTRQHNEVLAAGDGELRVTRQYVDVLAEGEGEVRVTRQHVEVLTQAWQIIEKDLSHNLSLTQTAVRDPMNFARSASSALGLSQEAVSLQTFFMDVESEMNLTSVVSRVHEASASNAMSLAQQIIKFYIKDNFIPVESVMALTQQADWEVGLYQHVTHNMVLTQQVEWQGPHYLYINTYFPLLTQGVESSFGCPWGPVEIETSLGLSSAVGRTVELSVNTVITLTQDMYRHQTPASTMNLVQSLTWGKTMGLAPTELDLNQTVNLTSVLTRSLTHTSVVGHALTYSIDTACGKKQYTPYIGESTIPGTPTPPALSEPLIQNDPATTRFKLVYPALAATTDSVELRAPELDNIDRLAFNRISRETRGGKLTVFTDPIWPKVQTIITTFVGLTKTEVDTLLAFFITHIGEEIGMQDWEGREWVGVITTPNEAAVQDGKERWTITYEFEGVLVDSYIPSDKMNLVDSVSMTVDYQRGITHDLDLSQEVLFLKV
jgi:hypothetical protein